MRMWTVGKNLMEKEENSQQSSLPETENTPAFRAFPEEHRSGSHG
jgi:hypothetical protein